MTRRQAVCGSSPELHAEPCFFGTQSTRSFPLRPVLRIPPPQALALIQTLRACGEEPSAATFGSS
eukprot:1476951-Alexandrium_andersonii.AAC.1